MVLKALVYNHRPVVGGGNNQVGIAPLILRNEARFYGCDRYLSCHFSEFSRFQ